jgi:histone acetyltransferase 1
MAGAPKRAKVGEPGAAAAAAVARDGGDDSAQGEDWVCDAREALHLKLVRRKADVYDDSTTFHPVFMHQLFKDEKIHGYKGLVIKIYKEASTLFTFFRVEYDAKHPTRADNVQGALAARMHHPWTDNLDEFIKHIGEDFSPPGRLTYEGVEADDAGQAGAAAASSEAKSGCSYSVFLGNFQAPRMKEYHQLMQMFLLFFIETSNYIDSEDNVWEVMILFEKRASRNRPPHFYFIGYATLYTFLAYPDRQRLRISQIFIVPPAQRQGHGHRLLNSIYRLGEERNVAMVNVEDPAPGFQFLRDSVDLKRALQSGTIKVWAEDGGRRRRHPMLEAWSDEFGRKAALALRVTEEQVRRCFDVAKLATIEFDDEEDYKAFRLAVKERLYKANREELDILVSREQDRKKRLHEMYRAVEKTYLELGKRAGIIDRGVQQPAE